jgi:competence protein ComGC
VVRLIISLVYILIINNLITQKKVKKWTIFFY